MVLAYRRPDGGTVPMEILLQVAELEDGTSGVVAVARDIRDRIESQARFQRLAEAEHARAAELNAVISAMGEGIVVCAADGRVTLANPAGQRPVPRRGDAHIRRDPRPVQRCGRARSRPRDPRRTGRALHQGRSGSLARALDVPGARPGCPGRSRGDDPRAARRDRRPPAGGDPGDVRRGPVARAAHPGDHHLRRRQAAGPRGLDPRRRDAPERVRRHHRGDRAPASTGRGRRRPESVRRPCRRHRRRTGPAAAPAPARGPVRAEPLAGRDRSRPRSSRTCRRSSPTRPTSSRSFRNLLSNAAKYGGAGATIDVVATSSRATRSRSGSSTTVRASRPRSPSGCSSGSTARAGTARHGQRRRDRALRVRPPDRRDGRPHLGQARGRGRRRIRVRPAGAARTDRPAAGSRLRASPASARPRGWRPPSRPSRRRR